MQVKPELEIEKQLINQLVLVKANGLIEKT